MKILITPRSFGKTNPEVFAKLKNAGLEIIRNETGRALSEKEMIEMIDGCAGVILGLDPMSAAVLASAPGLRAVSRYGVGLDNIDLDECARRGIRVSRTVGVIDNVVADYALALMLAVARRLALADRQCRQNDWTKVTGVDVYGKRVGIIGLGAIGKCVARRCKGFDMRVMASDPDWDDGFAREYGIARADADEICREADFITLHCVLNDSTRHIINSRRLAAMKPRAILVNTARGGLVDQKALLEALKNGTIWGAGLDVFDPEPPENPLWRELNNVIISSHCSSSTFGASELMGELAADNLLKDLDLN